MERMYTRYKEIKASLLNENIARWKKITAFSFQAFLIITTFVIYFILYYGSSIIEIEVFKSFAVLIAITDVVELIVCRYVLINKVPNYLWQSVGLWVYLTQIWIIYAVLFLSYT